MTENVVICCYTDKFVVIQTNEGGAKSLSCNKEKGSVIIYFKMYRRRKLYLDNEKRYWKGRQRWITI